MRTARRSSSAYDGLFSAFRAFLARRAQELTGLCLIAVAGAVAVALATWSVDDPSLNNATDLPVRNLLGWPGAIVADLLMQLLGLGAIAAVLPLALWGWRLMKSGDLGRLQLRFALWVIGAGAATALASALPPTQSWPLPTGLGGVVGDAILAGAKAITGFSNGSASAVLGFLFAGIAIFSLTAACGLGPAEDRHHEEPEEIEERQPIRRRKLQDWDEAEEISHDEPGWGIVSLGALAHGVMSLRAAARRWKEGRRSALDEEYEDMPAPPKRPSRQPGLRREPVLDGAPARPRPAPASVPMHDEDEAGWDEDDVAPHRCTPSRPARACADPRRAGAHSAEARQAHGPRGAALAAGRRELPAAPAQPARRAEAALSSARLGGSAGAERQPARRHAGGFRRPRRHHQGQSRSCCDAVRAWSLRLERSRRG